MHRPVRFPRPPFVFAAAVAAAAAPAHAHHVMGREMPATFVQGLLSGLGHPVIGLDHLAFVIAAGAVALLAGRPLLLPLLFVAATIAGAALHISGVELPAAELLIALTVVAVATLLMLRPPLSGGLAGALFAFAGLFHGYAYGESIVGAGDAPLRAYILGFAAMQYSIAAASGLAFRLAEARYAAAARGIALCAGGGFSLVGFAYAALALLHA